MKPIRDRKFWIVSPNVVNRNKLTPEWVARSLRHHAAFIGFRPTKDFPMGYKFAKVVHPGDVILIARRYKHAPHLVCIGVVDGPSEAGLNGLTPLSGTYPRFHGSRRMLSPFKPVNNAPPSIDIMYALRATMAMHRLHPNSNPKHRVICDWLEQEVGSTTQAPSEDSARSPAQLKKVLSHKEMEFVMKGRDAVLATKDEANLVREYQRWCKPKGHMFGKSTRGRLECDLYEKGRGNLIEAKSSDIREKIRMAVGQLLDYKYLGRSLWKDVPPRMAILLPRKPKDEDLVAWLSELEISVVWKDGRSFVDNAEGRFTE